MIKVIIAEDHQSLLDGIKLSLEFESDICVIGEANNGEDLVNLVRQKRPNVVLTDIRMPKCDGITAAKIIKKEFPDIQVIAFSMFDQEEAVFQMKAAGASGYITKNASLSKVILAIRTVSKNLQYFDNSIENKNLETNEITILSKREKEILKLVGLGKSSQEIANEVFISKSTVDTHRKNILKKIQLYGKTDLIRFAIERKYDF